MFYLVTLISSQNTKLFRYLVAYIRLVLSKKRLDNYWPVLIPLMSKMGYRALIFIDLSNILVRILIIPDKTVSSVLKSAIGLSFYNHVMKESKVAQLLCAIFDPSGYSPERSHRLLKNYGGIICLMNNLKTDHHQGLFSNNPAEHAERKKVYGVNSQPSGESLLKKSISEERDFMINLLFYLLTLRLSIKMLMVRDQLLGLKPLGEGPYSLYFYDEIVSSLLLLLMIFLKAMVNVEYFNINQDERKYKNQIIKVKRDGFLQEIREQELMVGDIFIVESGNKVRVDAILLTCGRNFMVSESQTILRQDLKMKGSVWKNDEDIDPFVLAGSSILKGDGQLMVCTVGENCSFRRNNQMKGDFYETSPAINKMKRMMGAIQMVGKLVSIALASWISIVYIWGKLKLHPKAVNWLDFLYILKVFTSFIGLICFLQRLKILRSLHFFLEMNTSDTSFRIYDRAALQHLSNIDILFVQAPTIHIARNESRGVVSYKVCESAKISELNSYFEMKIIGQESKQKYSSIFEGDVANEYFFQFLEGGLQRDKIKSLMNSSFITGTCVSDFIEYNLPIFQALNYKIGYLSSASNEQNLEFPKELLHISFASLDSPPASIKPKSSFNRSKPDCWVKIQNKVVMEDTLVDLTHRSFTYAKLFNVYMSMFINNILVFIIFCWYSACVQVVSLYWSLMIIIVNRYMFFTVYRRVTLQGARIARQMISIREMVRLNIFLLPYYILVASNLHRLSNLFIFFLVNSLFRIQTYLFHIQPSKSRSLLLVNSVVFIVLSFLNVLILGNNEQEYMEQMKNIEYTVGLLLLFAAYIIFL